MLNALIIGYSMGAVLAFFSSKWLLNAIANRVFDHPEQRRWIKWLGGIFAAMSFAPGIFTSMMFGGVIGGSKDRLLAEALGWGDTGTLAVLSVRVALVTAVTVAANAAIGSVFGYMVGRSFRRPPPA